MTYSVSTPLFLEAVVTAYIKVVKVFKSAKRK